MFPPVPESALPWSLEPSVDDPSPVAPVVPPDEDDPCWSSDPFPVEEESDPVETDESSLLEEDPWSEVLDEDASEE